MNPAPRSLDRVSDLTRRYARYGQSHPGLGLMLGGALVLLAMWLLPDFPDQTLFLPFPQYAKGRPWEVMGIELAFLVQHALHALCVVLVPVLWILGKEGLRAWHLGRHGAVEERQTAALHNTRLGLAALLGLVGVATPIGLMLAWRGFFFSVTSSMQVTLGLGLCVAAPWATLRFIRGYQEALIWLLGLMAVISEVWGVRFGFVHGPDLASRLLTLLQTEPSPWLLDALWTASLASLLVGLLQHLAFLRVTRELFPADVNHG